MAHDGARSAMTVAEMAQTSPFPIAPSERVEQRNLSVTATIKLVEDEARQLSAAVGENAEVAADAIDLHAASDDEWEVILYFHEADEHRRTTVAGIATRIAGRPAAVEWRELVDTDWVRRSQEALPAVRVGRVLVYPAHHRDQVRENDIGILIEAGQAFGTGHHASTRGCLLAIQWVLKSRRVRSALDIGTGTGGLAIALARHGIAVVATDIDPIAVRVARENARLNRVVAHVDVRATPSLSRILPQAPTPSAGYDLVVANILMEPLLALAPAIRSAVAPGSMV